MYTPQLHRFKKQNFSFVPFMVISLFVFAGILAITNFVLIHTIYSWGTKQVLSGETSLTSDPQSSYKKTYFRHFNDDLAWSPGDLFGTSSQPLISGKSGLLVDTQTGKILYEKESRAKRPIASLTKIMTAVIALEHNRDVNVNMWVSRSAAYIGENSMSLTSGETYTLEELLYGLILNSANDAAYVIAQNTAGDIPTFVKWMNIKAQELGLRDTYFADPSGLDDANVSSAQDLAILSRYLLRYSEIQKIAKTKVQELTASSHKYVYLENQTNLVGTYPGVAGLKTGYTEVAGLCLVTYAKNEGREVIGVDLGSNDRKGDMIMMLNHGFSTLGVGVNYPVW